MAADWSVIVAQPQRTNLVAVGLTALSVDHFIPTEQVLTVRNGRKNFRNKPFLGRYVFYEVNEAWRSLRHLRGVAGMLLATDYEKDFIYPAVVDPVQLEALREFTFSRPDKRSCDGKISYGDKVTPRSGPLANHIGRYDGKAKKHSRLEAALFNLFGREQRVVFQPGELMAAT